MVFLPACFANLAWVVHRLFHKLTALLERPSGTGASFRFGSEDIDADFVSCGVLTLMLVLADARVVQLCL
jgi:hypothetical protein